MAANRNNEAWFPGASTLVWLLLTMAFFNAGCAAPLAAIKAQKPEESNVSAWNRMHEKMSEDLVCPVGELTTKELSHRRTASFLSWSFEISGCGNTAIALIQESTGPRHRFSDAWQLFSDKSLRDSVRFAVGEKCPTWSVAFIDDTTRGVTACGDKTVYSLGLNGLTPGARRP